MTSRAVAAAARRQTIFLDRVNADIAVIIDNLHFLIAASRVNVPDGPLQSSLEAFEIDVRAEKIVRAAGSLMDVVSELKPASVSAHCWASMNEGVDRRIRTLEKYAEDTERLLERIGNQAATGIVELEANYYSSENEVR